jgi:hypothetical protein
LGRQFERKKAINEKQKVIKEIEPEIEKGSKLKKGADKNLVLDEIQLKRERKRLKKER